jgi:hypothetical protein
MPACGEHNSALPEHLEQLRAGETRFLLLCEELKRALVLRRDTPGAINARTANGGLSPTPVLQPEQDGHAVQ